METITKYKAFDGSEFLLKDKCADHEKNCAMFDCIMADLPPKPDDCSFSNGMGFIQHRAAPLLLARNRCLEFCKRYTDHKWIQETIDKGFDAHISYAMRILSETAPNYITKHLYRFSCIDGQLREWGQPYYAANPDKAENKQLNP